MPLKLVNTPSTTVADSLAASVQSLDAALTAWHDQLGRLAELAAEKLAAMRAADADALQRCSADEAELLERVRSTAADREAALAGVAQAVRWEGVKTARLPQLAARLPQPHASRIHAKSLALREIAGTLEKRNRLAAGVARNLQSHLRAVLEGLAQGGQESVVYGRSGQFQNAAALNWVDAVG
jgi:hypothetical protein